MDTIEQRKRTAVTRPASPVGRVAAVILGALALVLGVLMVLTPGPPGATEAGWRLAPLWTLWIGGVWAGLGGIAIVAAILAHEILAGATLAVAGAAVPLALLLFPDYHEWYWRFPEEYAVLGVSCMILAFGGAFIATRASARARALEPTTAGARRTASRTLIAFGDAVVLLFGAAMLLAVVSTGSSSYAPMSPPYHGDYLPLAIHVLGLQLGTLGWLLAGVLLGARHRLAQPAART